MPSRAEVPRSLRGRLTLWHGLVLFVTLVLFTAMVYLILEHSLMDQVRQSLTARADQVNRAVQQEVLFLRFRRHQVVQIPPPNPNDFASADTFVQVSLPNGEVLGTSESLAGTTLPPDQVTLQTGQQHFSEVTMGGQSIEMYSAPLIVDGQMIGVVQVGQPLRNIEMGLARLRLFAGLGLVVALVLSGLVVSAMAGRTLRPLERLIRTAESIGSSRDLSRRVEPPSSDDEVGRLALTFNRMLARLEASDAQLRETLGAQRRFVADASHELRTPLTTILGNSGMLLRTPEMTAADRQEALDHIHREAERMSRLVSNLLTLARADSGFALKREPLDLAPIAQDVASQVRSLAGEREVTTEGPESVAVMGDADALHQLLLILLENAMRYTPPDGRIALRIEDAGHEVAIVVSDTGIGIAPEHLPHVFERFYRVDPARGPEGTGLGLSIAEWIVEQHSGRIAVTSQPGQGSTFEVRLPRNGSQAELPAPQALPASGADSG